jgi:hypothetical protein
MELHTPSTVVQTSTLFRVTPLSKYLAMALFIVMPFIGGWIGYTYAPEKVVENTVAKKEISYINSLERSTPDAVHQLYFETLAVSNSGTKQYVYDNPYEGYFPVALLYKDTNIYDAASTSNFGLFRTEPIIWIEPYNNKSLKSLLHVSPDGTYMAVRRWQAIDDKSASDMLCKNPAYQRTGYAIIEQDTAKVLTIDQQPADNISYQIVGWEDNDTLKVVKETYELGASCDVNSHSDEVMFVDV